ncbi:MAG: DNA polymerase III subunit beta [Flavobacteriales bacterium]|nr:DNA polymerase III subunit beta [Flavobacteriales bacterium]MCX7768013.1 DNA polymerase III subunit beta [Flavobacteriales bacterium]MDW8409218.1 DNA polymerase III subunit beta [Flavobacteriales bacterium]
MKFLISSRELNEALATVSGVVVHNNITPVLQDFLMEVKDNKLQISATDLETYMTIEVPVEADGEGRFTVLARTLLDTLKTFPDQPLTFTCNPTNLSVKVTHESGEFVISGHPAEDFPNPPTFSPEAQTTLEGNLLALAIHRTLFATASEDRPQMSGVLFELSPEKTNFVATDAHKLVRYTRTDVQSDQSYSCIVPKKPLNILRNLLTGVESQTHLQFSRLNFSASWDNIRLMGRLVDARYPNYESVIPKDNPNVLTVDKDMFINRLMRVQNFTNKSTFLVRLQLAGSQLTLDAENLDFSSQAHEVMPCSYSGADMEIGFNSKFLIEVLKNIPESEVTMRLSLPSRPGVVEPAHPSDENEQLLMLIMPLMIGM